MRKLGILGGTGLAAMSLAVAVAVPAAAGAIAVGRKIEIDVDPKAVDKEAAAVWATYGGWCAIKDWHPLVADCKESKEGDTEFRTLTLKDGGVIKEKLLDKGNRTYKYQIIESPLPVKNYTAQFSVTPDDDDDDEINLVWAATFDAEGKPNAEARKTIDGIFKAGLDSIKSKLKKK